VTDYDTLRHLLKLQNNRLSKWEARNSQDLQPFVGLMTLAYRKGAMNEADPFSRTPHFVPEATAPLFWDGEVPSQEDIRRKSLPLLEDAHLSSTTFSALRLSPKLADLVREGYPRTHFMGTRVSRRKTVRLKPELCTFGVSIAFVPRGAMSSD
jgi:hypothetical protein